MVVKKSPPGDILQSIKPKYYRHLTTKEKTGKHI